MIDVVHLTQTGCQYEMLGLHIEYGGQDYRVPQSLGEYTVDRHYWKLKCVCAWLPIGGQL